MSEERLMKIIARNEMSEERLMKIIARLEGKIMDLEEALDRARANAGFWCEKAKESGFHDNAYDDDAYDA